MLMGVAIAGQIQRESPANAAGDALEIVPLVPSIVGALLTFLERFGLVCQPGHHPCWLLDSFWLLW